MDISHDSTDFGAQISFLGSEGLLSTPALIYNLQSIDKLYDHTDCEEQISFLFFKFLCPNYTILIVCAKKS
jgi:hypothetical protein